MNILRYFVTFGMLTLPSLWADDLGTVCKPPFATTDQVVRITYNGSKVVVNPPGLCIAFNHKISWLMTGLNDEKFSVIFNKAFTPPEPFPHRSTAAEPGTKQSKPEKITCKSADTNAGDKWCHHTYTVILRTNGVWHESDPEIIVTPSGGGH